MKKNRLIIFALILVVITGMAAFLHLNTREDVAEGTLKLSLNGEEHTIDISKLDYKILKGVRVNGKGEEIPVEGDGIEVRNLLEAEGIKDYAVIQVVADDSYTAELRVEEIIEKEKACLFLQEEGGLRLVVFGDENSKRSVSNVVQIIVKYSQENSADDLEH